METLKISNMPKLDQPSTGILRIGHRVAFRGILAAILLIFYATPALARPHLAGGNILSLSATDAPGYGDTVHITSLVQATSKIQKSNLYYTITIGSTLVATHTTIPPKFAIGDTFSDSWNISNSSFPSVGTYSVTLCWSTGNSHNCDIDSATTTFYSVPTLGWGYVTLGGAIFAYWLWIRKADFQRVLA
jgi:hypothetical protein